MDAMMIAHNPINPLISLNFKDSCLHCFTGFRHARSSMQVKIIERLKVGNGVLTRKKEEKNVLKWGKNDGNHSSI
jgi:hypothetical protein